MTRWILILLVGFSLASCATQRKTMKVNITKELQMQRLQDDQKLIKRQAVLASVKENSLFEKCYTDPGVKVVKRPAMASQVRLTATRTSSGELKDFKVNTIKVTPLPSGRCSVNARVAINESFGVMEYLYVHDWRKDGMPGMTTKSYGRPSARK